MIPKINLLFALICGTALCGLNFCATFTQWPYACLHNWTKRSFSSEKSGLRAIFMFLIPVLMTVFATTSCYYNGNLMYKHADVMMYQWTTHLVNWPIFQQVVFWKLVIINELLYPPKRSLGGVYWIHPVRPSVCLSVRPSVRGSVSGW